MGYISTFYTNGKIRILIEKPDEEKESDLMIDAYYDFCYYIEFRSDERMWGYCKCTLGDKDYNSEYKCCGFGCDWIAPAISITKEYNLGFYTWNGYAKDYWKYEDIFKSNEQNKKEKIEQYKKEQEKKYIEEQIKELQNRLNELT